MDENSLSALALACSIGALAMSLVILLRSTPQRVRKAAFDALQLVEEVQNGLGVIANRTVTFMDEVTRERASAASDREEAERKRRQAAAKLSKLKGANGEEPPAPQSLRELLGTLPLGDPRRMQAMRRARMSMES